MPSNTINLGPVKCHKCRHILVPDSGETYNSAPCGLAYCNSYNIKNFIYLLDEKVPDWVKTKIEEENWTKGKLHCQNCGSKVGSFDYVSGRKCECGSTIIPPIHLVTSQVDIPML